MEDTGAISPDSAQETVVNQCPDCNKSLDVTDFSPFSKIVCPHCEAAVRVRTTLGHYYITGLLGEGGMSQVFKAQDVNLGREVALKILHQDLSKDVSLTAMFEREAKLTASIHHPNVVKVYTVGNDQGYFYIAMELVNAISLEHLIGSKGAHAEEQVLNIAHDVTSGLRAAHLAGLIHRDIKPGNMLVTEDGVTKLVDFGLAVQHGGADESEDLWATPFYVPPEKLDGEPDSFLGDIYSLGATIYHALAGKPPFEANTSSMDELKRIKAEPISLKDAAPGVSKATIKLVDTMMAYSPDNRPASYDALLEALDNLQVKSFGKVRKGRVRETAAKIPLPAKIGIGVFGVAILGGILFALARPGSGSGVDPLMGGGGDRVINAGENTNAQLFLEARSLMAKGNLGKAEEIFDGLFEEESLSASARAWTRFNRGLITLLRGNEKQAREIFAGLQNLESFTGENGEFADQEKFLKKVGRALAKPLPLLDSEMDDYSPDSFQALGLFAGGVKNWNLGVPDSGIRWMEKFKEGSPPEEFDWIITMKDQVQPYRRDWKLFSELGNPSIKMSKEELKSLKQQLEAELPKFQTRGELPRVVKKRVERVEEILNAQAEDARMLAEAKAKEEEEQKAKKLAETTAKSKGKGKGKSANNDAPWTEDELEEKERLTRLLDSFGGYGDTLLFSAALLKLESEDFQTERGRLLRDELVSAYKSASLYLDTLASAVKEEGYEGEVIRREGVPLDARITDATSVTFVVDLGFGPNEIDVQDLSPAWLAGISTSVFGEPDAESAGKWEQAVWFSMACNLPAEGRRLADKLVAVDPGFAERWKLLEALQGN